MNVSIPEARATQVWFGIDNLWVRLADGRQLAVPLTYFPRLLKANMAHRTSCIISGGGTGVHWDALDEDISVGGLLLGLGDRSRALRLDEATS